MSAANDDYPVSVKAALRQGDAWVLLRNDRGEWELPGGRIDAADQSLEDVVRRECQEELGVDVVVGGLLDAYLFDVVPDKRVTIVTYFAWVDAAAELTLSDEHQAVGLFASNELDDANLPDGYRLSLERAAELL